MKASKRMLAILLSVLLLLPSVVLPLSATAEETGTVVTRFYEGQVATHDYTGYRTWDPSKANPNGGTGYWDNQNTLNIFGYVNNEGVPSPAYTVEKANLENLFLKFEIQISNPQNIEGFDATKFNGIVRLVVGGVQADYAYGWSNFVTAVDTWSEVSISLADIFASKLADLPDSGELTQLLLFAYDNHTIGGASNSDPEGTEANPYVSATTSVQNVRVEDIPQQTVEPDPDDNAVATWSQHDATQSTLLADYQFYFDWKAADGVSGQTSADPGIDMSGSAENGANPDYALQMDITYNVLKTLPEGITPADMMGYPIINLRSSQEDGAEMATNWVTLPAEYCTAKADGLGYTVSIPLSAIATGNLDWTDVKELLIRQEVKDEADYRTGGYISMTCADVKVVDVSTDEPGPEPEPVDKTALGALIDEATEKVAQTDVYTSESIANLQTALTAAQAVYNDEEADQDAVDAQETALQAALTALEEIPDEPEPEPTGKEALLLLLESKLSDAALNGYTGDSRQAYNELFATAQDVYDDEEATDEQVDEQITALQTADEVLVPLDADTVISFWEAERTSSEAHYLSLDRSLGAPVSLEGYEQGDLLLTYEIRIDATGNHPDPAAEGWLSYIRNGESRLWSVDAADAKDENRVVIDNLNCTVAGNKLESIQTGTWLTVTAEVPAAIMEAGQISKFHLFIYNDLHALNSTWFTEQADQGVTMSLRNVKIVKAHPEIVNKAVLESLIAQAQEIAVSGLYTQESIQALQTAITAAQAVVADDTATQDQVTAQTTALQIAMDSLVLAYPDIVWGDMNADEQVTAADALTVLQAATGKVTLSDELRVAANVDGKGDVTAADALMVLQYATQKITSFPLEEPVEEPVEEPTEEPAEG